MCTREQALGWPACSPSQLRLFLFLHKCHNWGDSQDTASVSLSESARDIHTEILIRRMSDIVKSAYMIDPSDGLSLVRREEAGDDIDKEYWQRVNQVISTHLLKNWGKE